MALTALLVIGLGLLIGIALIPIIVTMSSGTDLIPPHNGSYVANPNPHVYVSNPVTNTSTADLANGMPLLDIVHLLPLCFLGLIVIGAIWTIGRKG